MNVTTNNPRKYLAIKLWGKMLMSFDYYIEAEQEKAARMNAPVDALYERDGKWTCVSDLAPGHHFRATYERAMQLNAQYPNPL